MSTAEFLRARRLLEPCLLVLFLSGLLPAAAGAANSRWILEATGTGSIPLADSLFQSGWSTGLGIAGGLRYRVHRLSEVGIEAEFAQFTYDGLEGEPNLGGERRFGRLALSWHQGIWERRSFRRERVSLLVSAGWLSQTIAGTFGGNLSGVGDRHENGVGVMLGGRFSSSLYRGTRWAAGLRYHFGKLENSEVHYLGLAISVGMPLDGPRN